jgi:ATP-dependent exoDNAse (exonuclease V) beta subunit
MKLRHAQEEIVAYKHGRMAVSAVPGSGKTFTLAQLAATLLAEGNRSLGPGLWTLLIAEAKDDGNPITPKLTKSTAGGAGIESQY